MEGAAHLRSRWNTGIKGRLGEASHASRVSFFLAIALAGFAGAYLPATGSSAGSATTVPNPDPPPTTRSTPPPPPPRYVPPPPPAYVPPPPPPAPANVAPPPPPPARVSTRPRPAVHRTPKPHRARTAVATPRQAAPQPPPKLRPTRLVAAGLPVGRTPHSWRVPSAAVGLLVLSFLFLLLTIGAAVLPERALPARVATAVDGRREPLLFFAFSAVGVGLVLALLVAIATS